MSRHSITPLRKRVQTNGMMNHVRVGLTTLTKSLPHVSIDRLKYTISPCPWYGANASEIDSVAHYSYAFCIIMADKCQGHFSGRQRLESRMVCVALIVGMDKSGIIGFS